MAIKRRQKVALVEEEPYPYCRSARLHNFNDFPTPRLTWGAQKILRDAKFHATNAPAADHRFDSATQAGLRLHIRSILRKIKLNASIEGYDREEGEDDGVVAAAVAVEEEAVKKPGNSRKRRAVCNADQDLILNEKAAVGVSPMKAENTMESCRLRSGRCSYKEANPAFWVDLSKSAVEDYFLRTMGAKPLARIEKRPKMCKDHFMALVPGPGQWPSASRSDTRDVQSLRVPRPSRKK